MVFGPLLSNGRQRVGASKNARVEEMPLNIRIQWNAGTARVSECVLKTLACRGLRVGVCVSDLLSSKRLNNIRNLRAPNCAIDLRISQGMGHRTNHLFCSVFWASPLNQGGESAPP